MLWSELSYYGTTYWISVNHKLAVSANMKLLTSLHKISGHGLLIMCCMCNPLVNELYRGKEEFQCPSWRSFGKYYFLECVWLHVYRCFFFTYICRSLYIYLQDYDYTAVTFAFIPYIFANPLLQFKTWRFTWQGLRRHIKTKEKWRGNQEIKFTTETDGRGDIKGNQSL